MFGWRCKRKFKHQIFFNIFFKDFIYLFQKEERGGRKRGRETSMCGCLSCTPYQRPDLACNPNMCPDWELNQPPFGLQAGAQSTEPHQPGLSTRFYVLAGMKYIRKIIKPWPYKIKISSIPQQMLMFQTGKDPLAKKELDLTTLPHAAHM